MDVGIDKPRYILKQSAKKQLAAIAGNVKFRLIFLNKMRCVIYIYIYIYIYGNLHKESYFLDIGVNNNVLTETKVHEVCRESLKGTGQWINPTIRRYIPKCRLIHHFNPYLKMGPFHIEIHFYGPFRGVFHDFLSDKEMKWMVDISIPKLSMTRTLMSKRNSANADAKTAKTAKKSNTYEKSVVAWHSDIEYSETQVFFKISKEDEPLMYDSLPLNDPYRFTVTDRIMFLISKRIEMATNFNVTKRHSSSKYQATNYGLSGIVERHMDPIGYEKGAPIQEEQVNLVKSGDMVATFMAWMKDTELGGATAFTEQHFESVVHPTKGSAAFWINLSSCHTKDPRSMHAACPVLKGSKWILNKWIYSYNQWENIPCSLIPGLNILHFTELY